MPADPVQGVTLRSGVIAACTPGGRPASWAATGRSGGCSLPPYDSLNLARHVGDDADAVEANRDLVRRGVRASGLAVPRGVHGAHVVEATKAGDAGEADAVLTSEPDLGILVLGADCLLIGIAGDDDRTVAAVHCGWLGLAGDVVGATIAALTARGVRPRAVVLGPSICGSCYPVPAERADHLRETCAPDVADAALVRCSDGQPGIDVRMGVRARLAALGVPGDQVIDTGLCTFEDRALFSYRREGRTGRHGLVMVSGGSQP